MAKTIKAVVNTGKPETDKTYDIVQGSGAKGKPTRIKAIKGARYQLEDPAAKNVGPDNIKSKRVGKNLHVMLEGSNEADLIIEDYYESANQTDDKLGLYGRAEDGKLYEYIPEDPSTSGMPINLADGGKPVSQVLGGGSVPDAFGLAGLPLAAAGGFNALTAGAAAIGAAAVGGGGGGGDAGGTAALTPAQQIQAAAQNNTAASGNLAASVYTSAGVTGVDGTNLGLINGMLDTAAITNTSVDSTAKIQALVDAVKKAQSLANGTAGDGAASNLTATDVNALGLGAVIDTAEDRTLFNNILDNAAATGADTAAEILELASIADRIQKTAKGEAVSPALTTAELTKAGLVDVTDANLSAVLSSIAATPDNGQGADTLSELNNLVKDVNWAAATAPTTIAEATDGISANELADGIQATMTVPAGATAGDVMTIVVKDTSTNPATVKSTTTHVITAAEIAAGSFDITIAQADAATDGSYSVTTTTARASDGLSTAASTTNFSVDLTAHVDVTVIAGDVMVAGTANVAPVAGEFNAVERGTSPTTVATPLAISGTTDVEAGRTVTVRVHDINYTTNVIAATTTGQPNTWTVTLPAADAIALNHGNTYDVYVQTTDASGNVAVDAAHQLRVNIASPDTPIVDDLKTNDTTPTLTGVAQKIINPAGSQTDPANFRNLEAGDLVDITIGGVTVHAVVGTNTNGFSYNTATGVWSLNTGNVSGFTALTNGDHNISVSVTAGGITKTDISSNELHVNTNAPTLTLDPISGDNRINGTEKNQGLNLTGTTDAEAGSTVSVVLNGVTFTANVLLGASGQPNTFSIPLTPAQVGTLAASEGAKVVTATVTNEFGTQQTITPAGGVLIDTIAPTAPTLTIAEAANGISASELSDGVQVSAALPVGAAEGDVITFTVTDPSGDVRTVTHTVTGPEVTANTAAVTIPANKLAENGSYSIAASTVDLAGNPGTAGTAVTFTLDTVAPGKNADGTNAAVPAPVITIAEAAGGITADELADGTPAGIQTSVTLPTGSAVGDTITFTVTDPSGDVRTITHTVTNGDITAGSAAVTLPSSAVSEDGNYSLSVKTKDVAGNESAAGSTTFTLNAAASIISGYAQDNGATHRAPIAADYTSLGVTGMGGANQPTVATINTALATAAIAGANADTQSDVQAIVDAYQAILDNANTSSTANASKEQYTAIGVTGVNTTEKANLLGDVIDGKASADVDTAGEVQALADKALATMAGTANATQMADIGVNTTNVTADNLKAIQNALAAATEANKDSLADVQALVDAAITNYNAAATLIQNYATDNGANLGANPAPVIGDYNAMGVSGIGGSGQPTVGTINTALATAAIAGSNADTRPDVQAIVDAYQAILDEANGPTADANAQDPSAAQYAAIGVTGVDAGAEETLLGDVIDGKASTDVDTAPKVQALANAVQAVMDGTATKPQLDALGVTGVTPENIAAVQAALAAATDATQLNTLTGLQGVVNTAVNALDAIKLAAENNNAASSALGTTVFANAGVIGVDSSNLAAVQSALDSAAVNGGAADTKAEVQAIVDAVNAIKNNADGTPNNYATNPTQQQYAALGVTGVDTTAKETLLGDVIDGKAYGAVDSTPEIQTLANAVAAVLAAATGGTAPTLEQLQALGVAGVTAETLKAIQEAIAATGSTGAVDSFSELQGVVDAGIAAKATAVTLIKDYAQGNTTGLVNATGTAPTDTTFATAGVIGVTSGNLAAIQDALASSAVNGAAVDTTGEIQTLVDAYKDILAAADGTDANTTGAAVPNLTDYQAIGITGATTDSAALLSDVIDGKANADVDTVTEVQTLADAAKAAVTYTAANGQTAPTAAQLNVLLAGQTSGGSAVPAVTADNQAAVQAAVAAANASAPAIASQSELADVVKAAVDAYAAAIDKIADYAETGAVAPAYTDYAAAGVIGVDATNVAAINSAINAQAGADTTVGNANDRDGADTAAKVQTIVDAYKDILVAADGTDANTSGAAIPGQADYQAIGITGTTAASAALLSDVIDGKASADVDTIAKIQALATAAKVVISYDDPSTDIPPTKDQINVLVQGQTVGGNPVPAVTDAALAQVQAAIDAANSDGTPLATQADVAAVVKAAMDAYTAALNTIADYAETGAVAPADTDYTAAGVIGVNSGNLAAINSAINAQPGTDTTVGNANDRDAADTTAEVQAIVNAYQAILDEANGAGADLSAQDPTVTQYAAIGVTGVDAGAEETLLGDVIGRKVTADVDTVGEVQTLADTVAKVIAAAGSGTAPTESELTSLGLSGINAQNIAAVQAAIAATADNGSGVDTLTKLQALIASANDLPTGGVTITGTVKVGETLTASTTEAGNVLADADGLGTLSYKWFANGTEISGATGSTYQLAAGDLGKTITAQVSYTDAGGTATQVTSGATAAVAAAFTAGDAELDLSGSGIAGVTGKLIAPVQVEGKWYYYWDRSGDGTNADTGSANGDYINAIDLGIIFNKDINGNVNPAGDVTTDVYRYATINGVLLAVPTANGGQSIPGGVGNQQFGTTATVGGTSSYDDMLAIWDTQNGTATTVGGSGVPTDWDATAYWTATKTASGYAQVYLNTGNTLDQTNLSGGLHVALEVVKANAAPVLDASASPALTVLTGTTAAPTGATGSLVSTLVTGISDTDAGASKGIAITGFDSANGTLWYSLNGGSTWTNAGTVSGTSALLLSADADTRLYYQPSSTSFAGSAAPITFRAWDGTFSSEGAKVDASTATGGKAAFSTATDTIAVGTANQIVNPDGSISEGAGYGGVAGSSLGTSVSSAGDVNNDGFGDFIVSAHQEGSGAGAAYVVYGNASGTGVNLSSGSIASSQGFKIQGQASTATGYSVTGLGDINGDGYADVLVGSTSTSSNAYVVYGGASNAGVNLSNGTIAASTGFKISLSGGNVGLKVSGLGDINGDGLADIAVVGTNSKTFVVYGKASNTDIVLNTTTPVASDGFMIEGAGTVSGAGDVNGDGIADIVIGTNGASTVIYGQAGSRTSVNAASPAASDGFVITNGAASSGSVVSSAGDFNGDGFADLIVGGNDGTLGGGKVYVVLGSANGAALNVTSMTSSQGFEIVNSPAGGAFGLGGNSNAVASSAGDLNGDGLSDLIVSAPSAGVAYVVYGNTTGGNITLSSGSIASSQGFKISGDAAAWFGNSVSNAGDLNGDGLSDLVIGAPAANSSAGAYHIILGGTQTVTSAVNGTGTAASEAVLGTAGADTLTGGGGVDRFMAGKGNDTVVLSATDVSNMSATAGTTRASVQGGEGFDTVRLSGGANLDLTTVTNTGAMGLEENSRIESIERVDLATDSAANTLTISAKDVNDMAGFNAIHTGTASADGATWTNVSGTALSNTTQFHQVVVDGGNNDGVTLAAGAGFWSNAGTVNNGTSDYVVWQNTQTNSQVIVKSGVTVTNNDTTPAGDAVINLGTSGKLIAPVQVEGKWYYYWDRSGNGESGGGDLIDHDALDTIFNLDINGNTRPNDVTETNDSYRYALINGVLVGLPTANGGMTIPQGISTSGVFQNGTAASQVGVTNNSSYDGMLALWDIVGGSATSTNINGTPTNWVYGNYATSTPSGTGRHIDVNLNGMVTDRADASFSYYVALEVVKTNAAPTLADTTITLSSVYANSTPTGAMGDLVSSLVSGISDGDAGAAKGIAITGAATGGTVWYSLNGGSTWQSVAASALSDSNALLLAADADTRVYFQSATGATSVSNALTLRAWDMTQHLSEGVFANTVANGGKAEFSTGTDTVGFTATPTASTASISASPSMTGGSYLGWNVAGLGDVNGDGYDDVLLSEYANYGNLPRGYVVFGSANPLAVNVTSITSGGSAGFRIEGGTGGDTTFGALSGIGDVNGDGLADMVFAPSGGDAKTYVVYGKTNGNTVNLASLGTQGFAMTGLGYNAGYISGAGDVNGDGLADFIMGQSQYDSYGRSFVVFGKTDNNDINVNNVTNGTQGFAIDGGDIYTSTGTQVSAAGDVNGDGLADLLVSTNTGAGRTFVVFGKASGTAINLSALATSGSGQGFMVSGESLGDQAISVSNAGDVNGDGLADFVVGAAANKAAGDSGIGFQSGRAYVVFGKASDTAINLSALTSGSNSQGFVINGNSNDDNVGRFVSAAGDFNGDGLADVIVSASKYGQPVRSYVVFGKANGTNINLTSLDAGIGGFRIDGGTSVISDTAMSMSAAGDINGDGFDDLFVGSRVVNGYAGAAYVVYGGTQYTSGIVDFVGTTGANTQTGTSAAETFMAGDGDDTLIGGGGADVMNGGKGRDTFELNASNVTALANNLGAGGNTTQLAKVDGGTGYDTLRMAQGAGNLDLTAITNVDAGAGDGTSRINSIERIDLATDTAANTLTIAARDVNDMAGFNTIHTGTASADGNTWTNVSGNALSDTTQFHQVVVDGSSNDGVTFAAGAGFWSNAGQVSNDGGTTLFDVWQNTQTNSQVIVKSGVTVTNNDATPDAVISLGSFGNLIAPVQVEGKWYYFWDRNSSGTAEFNDITTHDTLDGIFKYDINGNLNPGSDTTDVYRYATIHGVKLALPTANGGVLPAAGLTDQPGTSATGGGTSDNSISDDLLAIWDNSNGTSTTTNLDGTPGGWANPGNYWSATPSAGGHLGVYMPSGALGTISETSTNYVALQVLPVVIDLNRDGVLSYGQVTMDVNGDGALDLTKWAGAQDGVLVWDKFGDGLVHDNSQYAFAQYATTYANGLDANGKAPTDLSGLAEAFDSNQDGVFNANDAKFAEFKVWQDANQNGVSDEGEVRGLLDWGILSIDLNSDGLVRTPAAGVTEAGRTTATATDGSHVLVSDAAFAYNALDYTVTGNAMNLLGADMHLDLSSVVAVHSNVTAMDLTGTGANTIKLSLADVLSVATDASIANGVHKLTLTGDANDTVELDLSQWANTGNTVTEGDHTYAVYNASSSAAAQLLIDQHMVMVNHA